MAKEAKKVISRVYNGKEWKLSFQKKPPAYYTMYPVQKAKKGDRGTKRQWLGSDYNQAVIDFHLFWNALEKKGKNYIPTEAEIITTPFPHYNLHTGEVEKNRVSLPIDDTHYYNWLREKVINNEYQDLADGTGFHNFVRFPEFINHTKDTPLAELYNNYTNSRRYKRATDKDEKNKTKKAWELFLTLCGKVTLEQVNEDDVKGYEDYLHRQDYVDRTINHYKNRIVKIINFNLRKIKNKPKLREILGYFDDFEELEINSSESIAAQVIELEDFNELYNNASVEMKAIMMLCLNTATYIREVSRFKISDINLKHHTLMTKRNKKGRCRKFAYLWDRTVNDLRAYLDTRKDTSDVLFIAQHGGAYVNGAGIRTKWWDLRKKAKLLHIEFNQLRDTFETIGKEIGINQYHIDMVMGHSSGKTSERYTHRRIHNELKEACLAVEKDFFRSKKNKG